MALASVKQTNNKIHIISVDGYLRKNICTCFFPRPFLSIAFKKKKKKSYPILLSFSVDVKTNHNMFCSKIFNENFKRLP